MYSTQGPGQHILAAEALDFARKTYRYLRIAVAGMVAALLISILIEWRSEGSLLSAISSYYFTPVHAVFVGSLVMIGICLIAIRGYRPAEEIALNVSGMLAPVVAFVPTSHPGDRPGAFTSALPINEFQTNNLLAVFIATLVSVVAVQWFGNRRPGRGIELSRTAKIGLGVAGAIVAVLVVVQLLWGWIWVHNVAAIGTILGLWAAATDNATRHIGNAATTDLERFRTGAAGSLFFVGIALVVGGLIRVFTSNGPWVLVAGVALLAVLYVVERNRVGRFLAVVGHTEHPYCRLYLGLAVVMAFVGPLLGTIPDWDHRTFFVELAELVPFALFWVVQTVELWRADPHQPASSAIDVRAASDEAPAAPGDDLVPRL